MAGSCSSNVSNSARLGGVGGGGTFVVARRKIRKASPGPISNSPHDPVVAYCRADLQMEPSRRPTGRVNRNIIPSRQADEAVLVEGDTIAVAYVPDFCGERVFRRLTSE